jgi:hypothetical protein
MKFRWFILAIGFSVSLSIGALYAQTAEEPAAKSSSEAADVLSTEMSGVDTLDVMPREMIMKSGEGTRRVKLETTVFHREEPVIYRSEGLRDPFRALVVNEMKEGEVKTDLLRLEEAVLTGIVWSSGDYVALVRDKDGKNFFLRKGDPIYKGAVVEVEQSRATFEVSDFGDYNRIVLEVQG